MEIKASNTEFTCNLCNGSNVIQLYNLTDDMFEGGFSLGIKKCRDCGLIFLDKEIFKHLKDIHEEYWIRTREEHVEKDISWLIENISRFNNNRGRILEIGSGKGDLLIELEKNMYDVYGVEISKSAADVARRKGLNVINEQIEMVKFPDEYFDCVIMYGVIEHLTDPFEVLSQVHRWLRPGGGVIIFTPNADSIFHVIAKTLYLLTFSLYVFPLKRLFVAMHTFYFNAKTLSLTLKKTDFKIELLLYSNLNINIVYHYFDNRAWANNLIFRKMVDVLFFIAKLLKRHSHLLIIGKKEAS